MYNNISGSVKNTRLSELIFYWKVAFIKLKINYTSFLKYYSFLVILFTLEYKIYKYLKKSIFRKKKRFIEAHRYHLLTVIDNNHATYYQCLLDSGSKKMFIVIIL